MKYFVTTVGLVLMSTSALALDQVSPNSQELYANPIFDHQPAERAHNIQQGAGEAYASPFIAQPADHKDDAAMEIVSVGVGD